MLLLGCWGCGCNSNIFRLVRSHRAFFFGHPPWDVHKPPVPYSQKYLQLSTSQRGRGVSAQVRGTGEGDVQHSLCVP